MATATQPIQALVDLLFQNATQNALATAPPANTAPANAEPQDTVTLTNTDTGNEVLLAVAQAQVQTQEAAVVNDVLNVPANNNAANNANAALDPLAADAANGANAALAAANDLLAPAANAGANAANNTTQTVQQQELAQLAQVLEQMGIPPSSIPVVQQLAMLLFLSDPQALQQFVNQLEGIAQQNGNPAPVNSEAGPAQQNNAAPNNAARQNGVLAAQFQQLQLTFTAVGVAPAVAAPVAAVAVAGAAGAAQRAGLNVRA